ncbi:MAG: hypothetical protein JXA13_13055 [Anaerolineales bacterium]|nr:hypothetical protein [Anaerolineales bacterium]
MSKRWIIFTALLLGPPLMWLAGVILFVVRSYDGMCPGMMDVPAYPCSVWELIARNTLSPFSLPVHVCLCGGWFVLVGIGVGVYLLVISSSHRDIQ